MAENIKTLEGHWVLALPTQTILDEISRKEFKRRDVAQTYRECMKAEDSGGKVDWPAINNAILRRWSRSGLEYIKQLAWSGKCFAAVTPQPANIEAQINAGLAVMEKNV